MRVLLSSLPHLGHVIPMNTLKVHLESRGHDVSWEIPEISTQFAGPLTDHLANFQALVPQSEKKLLARLREEHFDLLITDPTIFAANSIREKTGIPWAMFSNLPIFYDIRGIPLVIQGSIFEFEQVRAENLIYSGPTMPFNCIDLEIPVLFEEIKTSIKPVIYVTQGTVANSELYLLDAAKKACAKDYICVDWFMQYHYFMQFADVFVTNGGYGGVQAALYSGIPMIIAGETEDKPIVALKAAAAGIAINLNTSRPDPTFLRAMIDQVLADKAMKSRCEELSKIARAHMIQPTLRALENLAKSEGEISRIFPKGVRAMSADAQKNTSRSHGTCESSLSLVD